jgi:phosphatidylglycerophosphatase A
MMNTILVKFLQRTGATIFFLGYIPGAPGTVGSIVAAACWWLIHWQWPQLLAPQLYQAHWLTVLGLIAVSIILSSRPRELFNDDDPGQVIVDEFAGQMVTYLFIPFSLPSLLLGFALFRFFDIIKPFPVHSMEEIEGGTGITMDDVVAGVYANLSLNVLIFFYHTIHKALLRA